MMRICDCREPAEITPCKVLAERRWFSEKTEKLGLGTQREHMDSRARGAASVASGGSMTWREGVGSDGVDPSCKPPEMLTHPPHLVGVHKLFFPAVCEVGNWVGVGFYCIQCVGFRLYIFGFLATEP